METFSVTSDMFNSVFMIIGTSTESIWTGLKAR